MQMPKGAARSTLKESHALSFRPHVEVVISEFTLEVEGVGDGGTNESV